MTKSEQTEAVIGLPPVNGLVVVRTMTVEKEEKESKSGSTYDSHKLTLDIVSAIPRLPYGPSIHSVNISGWSGQKVADMKGKGPFLAKIGQNDKGYSNLEIIITSEEFQQKADLLA